jgi:PTH1 family peptidyl-tRNA hydrolase
LRPAGTHAGHNGLKDIQSTLLTDQYPKLRFGIGSNYSKGMQIDFVLGKWSENEQSIVQLKIEKSVIAIEDFATIGIDKTMNEVNKLNIV